MASPHGRYGLGGPIAKVTVKKLCQLFDALGREAMFGDKVGWILLAKHLFEVKPLATDGLLDPQNVGVQVPQFAKSLPTANAQGGGGVCLDSQWH